MFKTNRFFLLTPSLKQAISYIGHMGHIPFKQARTRGEASKGILGKSELFM